MLLGDLRVLMRLLNVITNCETRHIIQRTRRNFVDVDKNDAMNDFLKLLEYKTILMKLQSNCFLALKM